MVVQRHMIQKGTPMQFNGAMLQYTLQGFDRRLERVGAQKIRNVKRTEAEGDYGRGEGN